MELLHLCISWALAPAVQKVEYMAGVLHPLKQCHYEPELIVYTSKLCLKLQTEQNGRSVKSIR